jgi:hypothetical protein
MAPSRSALSSPEVPKLPPAAVAVEDEAVELLGCVHHLMQLTLLPVLPRWNNNNNNNNNNRSNECAQQHDTLTANYL